MRVPSNSRNRASHAGCAGHAGAVTSVPSSLSPFRVVVVNNPKSWLTSADVGLLKAFIQSGRRLVLVGDHCKYGCFVDQARLDQVFATLGLHMSYDGTEGVTSGAAVTVVPHPLTVGVSTVFFEYSGGLTGLTAPAQALVKAQADGDVLAARERPAFASGTTLGDVVVLTDMDTLTHTSDPGTSAFLLNLVQVTDLP